MKDADRTRTFGILSELFVERVRQVDETGHPIEEDDSFTDGGIADAAAAYASTDTFYVGESVPELWPWPDDLFNRKDRRTNLVRAGALIVAEIERLDRASEKA
jgi:hypothetical protein